MFANMLSSTQKKYRLLRTWLARRPIWCAWQVTYRCNFHCAFCQYWRDPMGTLPEQTVEDFERGARKLAQMGTLLISMAGGEPFLRDDIVEVVRAVARWHMPFITTNGTLSDENLPERLFAAGLWGVSVSIDYANPQRHDRSRGHQGAFAQALRTIEIFSQARRYPWQRVNLMAVLLDDNLDQVEELIRIAARLDCYFMIQPYSSMKTGSTNFKHLDRGGVGARLVALRQKYPNFLSNPRFLSRFDEALNGGVPGCAAGRAFFNIDSTGDVAICVEEKSRPVANLYRHHLNEIVTRLQATSKGNHCSNCWYNCRGEVESLYSLDGLWHSLPNYFYDYGRPKKRVK